MINTIGYILICFIPLITAFICVRLLVTGFKWTYGIRACLLGLVSVAPIEAILFFLGYLNMSYTSLQLSVSTIIIYGLVEELIKMLMMFLFPSKKIDLKTFIVYGALVGLSFACFEDFVYLVSGFSNLSHRLITAGIIHVTATMLSSIFVYSIKNKRVQVLPFIFAVLMHGLYNYFSIMPHPYSLFAIAVIAFGVIECRARYISYKNKSKESIVNKGAKAYQDTKVESKKADKTVAENKDTTIAEVEKTPEVNTVQPVVTKIEETESETLDNTSDEELAATVVEIEDTETSISEEEVSAIEDDVKANKALVEEYSLSEKNTEPEEKDETLFKIQISGVNPSKAEDGTVVRTIVKATRKTKAKAEDKAESETKAKTAAKATSVAKATGVAKTTATAKKTAATAEKKTKTATATKTTKTTKASGETKAKTTAVAKATGVAKATSVAKATGAKKTAAKSTATATKAKTTSVAKATGGTKATGAKKATATKSTEAKAKAATTKKTTAAKTAAAKTTAAKKTTTKTKTTK